MVNYGSSTNLGYIITAVNDSVSSNLKAYGLTAADNWINSKIKTVPSTIPALVAQAAEYYAAAVVYRVLYDTTAEESSSAVWYEKKAHELLEAYSGQNATEDNTIHPYSSSKSPSRIFTKRNLRTTTDDDDIEYVDNNDWTSDD